MAKTLEYSELDLSDRRSVEQLVTRYRNGSMSRSDFLRRLGRLGYERESVLRYAGLVESTFDRAPVYERHERVTPWWESEAPAPWHRLASERLPTRFDGSR